MTRFKPYDITTEQFSVLFNVDRGEGVNQKELAARVFKDQTHHCGIIDLLEKKGWVERRTKRTGSQSLPVISHHGRQSVN
ncbi:MarR family transcriptional regulator [Paenibacillus amylolyticus]|nr:MarR family transcriptional regulator [Paenibacillus amylolyticus]